MNSDLLSRRAMLHRSAAVTAALAMGNTLAPLFAAPATRRFKIGACDWSLGKTADTAALTIGKQIGLDGVQISLGTATESVRLRQAEVQRLYRLASVQTGVQTASLAIGEMNNVPFKSDPRTIGWVEDAIEVCRMMGMHVILLAFFSKGDLRGDKEGVDEVMRRLKTLAPRAEKAGVALGIESWLSAEQHIEILDRVGSPAVKVYYDVCNSNDMGYDIYAEIRKLGKRICEFHAKENGSLLGQGKVDFRKVRAALDDIGYTGWIQIEGAIPSGKPMLESYQANCKFLRGIFPA